MTTSTLERIIEAAAEARSRAVRAPSDRPSERRSSEEPGSRPAPVLRAQSIEVRAAGDDGSLHFTGFASVYETLYEMWDIFGPYEEQVVSGAGAKSLAREDLDVPLVLQHDALRRIARTTNDTLTVDEREVDGIEGLYVDAPSLDGSDADVAYIAPKLRSGLIDEMSFRFRIIRGQWSQDWSVYSIEEYDIHRGDVAIVAYGANPHTVGAGLRAAPLSELTESALRSRENELYAELKRRELAPLIVPVSTGRSLRSLEMDIALVD